MGPKTLRRAAIAAVVLVLGVVAVVLLQRYQVSRLGRGNLAAAEAAEKAGDLAKAEEAYLQHVTVFPDDLDAQVKYADVLLRRSRTPGRIEQAVTIYMSVLNRDPSRDDARRAAAVLLADGGGEENTGRARDYLGVLLKKSPEDPELWYYMGRCQERTRDFADALASYEKAFKPGFKDRFDARGRAARLARRELNQPEKADAIVDEMVAAEPAEAGAYMERGRYRSRVLTGDGRLDLARADFEEAARLTPKDAAPYLELSRLALEKSPPDVDAAGRAIAKGLEADPASAKLYIASAQLQLGEKDPAAAMRTLRKGLDLLPDDYGLRLAMCDILASKGATAELRAQVEELKRLGLAYHAAYFEAYAHINAREWKEARRILADELAVVKDNAPFRASIDALLARCYANLGDVERQRNALAAAVSQDPTNVAARLAWIAEEAERGDVDRAMAEYRALADSQPAARLALARLLILRNRRMPAARQDWAEVDQLVAQVERDAPGSNEAAVLRADVLLAQGRLDEAAAVLQAARDKGVRDAAAPRVWIALADVAASRKDLGGALRTLEEAREALGDSAALRVARAKVVAARGGPELAANLVKVADDLDALDPAARAAVLDAVGDELIRRGARAEASAILARRAALTPNDVQPRLKQLALAVPTGEDPSPEAIAAAHAEIKAVLDDIEKAEGPDGYMVRFARIEYLLWQAKVSGDASEKARFRNEARTRLAELRSRRPDWSLLPLASARLEEQEIELAKDDADRLARTSRAADLYRQAVDMGQRNLQVVQRATELLMEAGRTAEVGQLWNRVPALNDESMNASLVERSLLDKSLRDKEFDKAEELVRLRIAARPKEFSERILLAQILLWQQRTDEAEEALRQALADDPSDPSRYIVLVQFLVATGRTAKAEEVAGRVEKGVGPERGPLALAGCAGLIAQGYQAAAQEAPRARWLGVAKGAYAKAQAAKPGDFALRREYVEFLLRSQLVEDVEKELTAILKPPAGAKAAPSAADLAWARRTLALTYVARFELAHDYQQALKALYLYAPPGRDDVKAPEDPADLRVLARIYEAQRVTGYRAKALAILEKLAADGQASEEDRFLLARIYAADGRWDDAHREYRALMAEDAKPTTSAQALNQKVVRLVHYASQLIGHVKAGGADAAADAAEARELIERLRKFQPAGFNVLALECRLDAATGSPDKATARIREIADRPKTAPELARATADLAEELGLMDLAEGLYKRNATEAARLEHQLDYAAFLGRRGRIKEALDVCEPLWKATPNPEPIAPTVIAVLLSSRTYNDESQIGRVSGWIERSLEQNPSSPLLTVALATIRDRQQRYDDAVALYRKAVELRGGEVIPLNNLAWLLSLQGEKGAAPLEMINKAIALRGPIPEFLDTRGVVHLTNGQVQPAIKDLEEAILIDPSAGRYFHLARAYLEAGEVDKARRSLDRARASGLDPADIHPLERPALAQVEKALK